MNDRELMKLALEALDWAADCIEPRKPNNCDCPVCVASDALRERLAQPEPWKVEEVYKDGVLVERRMKRGPDCAWEPLLTPPRREWVGLTDEEKLHLEIMGGKSDVMLAEAIEAKLKEKNA